MTLVLELQEVPLDQLSSRVLNFINKFYWQPSQFLARFEESISLTT